MDILFNSVIDVKEGVMILAIKHLQEKGEVATWKKLSSMLQISPPTARKIGGILKEKGLVNITTNVDELGGFEPTILTLNEEAIERVLK